MQSRSLMWLLAAVGSSIGGFIPTLWGAGFLSFSSVLLSGLGAFAGLYMGFKMTQY